MIAMILKRAARRALSMNAVCEKSDMTSIIWTEIQTGLPANGNNYKSIKEGMNIKKDKNCIIYCRVSSKEQEDRDLNS